MTRAADDLASPSSTHRTPVDDLPARADIPRPTPSADRETRNGLPILGHGHPVARELVEHLRDEEDL